MDINGFNESLVTCEDVDFCYRMRRFGKIVSDNKLKVTHYGEARTIKEFIKKENWRGVGNLKGILSHGFSFKELPSLIVPIYFGFFLPVFLLIGLIFYDFRWLILGLLLMILPGMAAIFRLRRRISHVTDACRLFLLLQVYFFSRTIAVFKRL
jgi:GT2 family glycosyltransferase